MFLWLLKVYGDKSEYKKKNIELNNEIHNATGVIIQQARQRANSLIQQANEQYAKVQSESEQTKQQTNHYTKMQLEQTKRACEFAMNENRRELEKVIAQKDFAQKYLQTQISNYPTLGFVLADFKTAVDEETAKQLERKKHPAVSAADEIRKSKQEKRILIAQNTAYKWELEYIRNLIPELHDITDNTVVSQEVFNPGYNNQHDDAAGYWLTPEEYQSLSTTEKYQRALDRYKHRHKTNKEIGDAYELYIGYLYEKAGYEVTYYGMKNGLEDLGRDLICKNGHDVQVVQCKCWSVKKEKIIREKYINQLFGTTFKYYIEQYPERNASHFIEQLENQVDWSTQNQIPIINPLEEQAEDIVTPVFISTVKYSDTAQNFANDLYVVCKTIPMGDYPMIKCNINQNTGEKIYHLPFDQQYRTCKINQPGECYATTVAEAEKKGFRRAMRWQGNNSSQKSKSLN